MKRLRLNGLALRLTTLTTTVAAASLMSAPQASAATTCASTIGVQVCFEPYGDHFYVKDTQADGYRPGVTFYYTGSGGWYSCDNPNGNGTTKDCNYDLPEHKALSFRAEVCDGPCQGGEGSSHIRLSDWKNTNTS